MKIFSLMFAGAAAISMDKKSDVMSLPLEEKKMMLLSNQLKTTDYCQEMCDVVFFENVLEKCAPHCDSAAKEKEAIRVANPRIYFLNNFQFWIYSIVKLTDACPLGTWPQIFSIQMEFNRLRNSFQI